MVNVWGVAVPWDSLTKFIQLSSWDSMRRFTMPKTATEGAASACKDCFHGVVTTLSTAREEIWNNVIHSLFFQRSWCFKPCRKKIIALKTYHEVSFWSYPFLCPYKFITINIILQVTSKSWPVTPCGQVASRRIFAAASSIQEATIL